MIIKFDNALREGFEAIIHCRLDGSCWSIVRISRTYRGIGFKSGIKTAGVQYLVSLINRPAGIRTFVPNWNLRQKGIEETEKTEGSEGSGDQKDQGHKR